MIIFAVSLPVHYHINNNYHGMMQRICAESALNINHPVVRQTAMRSRSFL